MPCRTIQIGADYDDFGAGLRTFSVLEVASPSGMFFLALGAEGLCSFYLLEDFLGREYRTLQDPTNRSLPDEVRVDELATERIRSEDVGEVLLELVEALGEDTVGDVEIQPNVRLSFLYFLGNTDESSSAITKIVDYDRRRRFDLLELRKPDSFPVCASLCLSHWSMLYPLNRARIISGQRTLVWE